MFFGLEGLIIAAAVPVVGVVGDWIRQRILNSQMKKVIGKSKPANADFRQIAFDSGYKMLFKHLTKHLK